MAYDKNRWELYDPNKPNEDQPHSFITKRKLDKMEEGIAEANVELEIGTITTGDEANATIIDDTENQRRLLNITFPPAGKGAQGEPGQSAYDLWLSLGNTGTEQEFLDYLKGIDGKDGKDGAPGKDGEPGPKGDSTYQIWLSLGNSGTEEDFIKAMKGEKGEPGKSIYTSTIEIDENSKISRTQISNSENISVGDSLVDTTGNLYIVTAVSDETISVGSKLFSIKGEKGDKGEPGDGINGSEFIRF